jgi:hypothetical protein
VFASSLVRSIGPSIASTIDALDLITINEAASDKELATPWYSDQVFLSRRTSKLSRAHAEAAGWGGSEEGILRESIGRRVGGGVPGREGSKISVGEVIFPRGYQLLKSGSEWPGTTFF